MSSEFHRVNAPPLGTYADERDRIGEILDALARLEAKLDDVVARGKKTNSLVGMLVGRKGGK